MNVAHNPTALQRMLGFPETSDESFHAWMQTPHGREACFMFCKLALKMRWRGWKRYGAKAIVERIRFHYNLRHGPDSAGFKFNNSWTRRLAQHAVELHSDLDGFFEFREPHNQHAAKAKE